MSNAKPQIVIISLTSFSECIEHFKHEKPYAAGESDIWALGILLINIITGKSPWNEASKRDIGFKAYLREGPSYFQRTLAIPTQASEMLARILEVDVSKRLNITQIRDALKSVPSFYDASGVSSEASVACTNTSTLRTWGNPTKGAVWPEYDPDSEAIPSPYASSTSAGDISTFVNGAPAASDDIPAIVSSAPALCNCSSQDDCDSDTDSEGPITPETLACDPASIIDGFSLEDSWTLKGDDAAKHQQPTKKVSSVQRVVHAVQRMRIRA